MYIYKYVHIHIYIYVYIYPYIQGRNSRDTMWHRYAQRMRLAYRDTQYTLYLQHTAFLPTRCLAQSPVSAQGSKGGKDRKPVGFNMTVAYATILAVVVRGEGNDHIMEVVNINLLYCQASFARAAAEPFGFATRIPTDATLHGMR